MLNEHQQEILTERIVRRIEQLDEYILSTIGNRVKQIGTLSYKELHQVKQMLKYGKELKEIERYLAKVTNLNLQDIENIFIEEAKINQDFAKQFYLAKGKEFVPYADNLLLQEQVKAIARTTLMEYANISRTTGFMINGEVTPLAQAYRTLIDNAVMLAGQGKESYQDSIKNILKELGENGIRTIEYDSGRTMRLDSAVRMNVMDGMRMMSNELQNIFGQEYGADGVEISVHENPAPDHEDIQGRQFRIEEYDKLEAGGFAIDVKGNWYDGADRRHISTLNCYHGTLNIVVGVSEPRYTDEELQAINKRNHDGFELGGKHYTNYEGTQLQRRIETEVRKHKEGTILYRAAGQTEELIKEERKVRALTKKYIELCEVSGLPPKKSRMSVSQYVRIKIPKGKK